MRSCWSCWRCLRTCIRLTIGGTASHRGRVVILNWSISWYASVNSNRCGIASWVNIDIGRMNIDVGRVNIVIGRMNIDVGRVNIDIGRMNIDVGRIDYNIDVTRLRRHVVAGC
jgi:hypothetical protein